MSDRLASSPEAVVRRVVHVERPRRTGRRRRIARVALATVAVLAIIALVFGCSTGARSRRTSRIGRAVRRTPGRSCAFPERAAAPPPCGGRRHSATAVARLDRPRPRSPTWNSTDPFDVLLLLGDNVYPAGDPARLRRRPSSSPFAPRARDGYASCCAILGNHDMKDGNGPAQIGGAGHAGAVVGARRSATCMLVGLDSNDPTTPSSAPGWSARWPRPTRHGRSWPSTTRPTPPATRARASTCGRSFTPLFERYGVQLVLSGHDHDYQRSTLINGVTYVVSGAAAGTRRTGERGVHRGVVLLAPLRRRERVRRPTCRAGREPGSPCCR